MAFFDIVIKRFEAVDTIVFVYVAVVVLYLLWTVQSWYRLSHIPGPLGHGLSVWGLLRTVHRGKFHLEVKNLAETYGRCLPSTSVYAEK